MESSPYRSTRFSPPKLPKKKVAKSRDFSTLDNVRCCFKFIEVPHITESDWECYKLCVREKYLVYEPKDLLKMSIKQLKKITKWYRPSS